MLKRLFPATINNDYHGHVLAIWLFAPIVALKAVMGFNVAGLNPFVGSRYILQAADGVPVDTYAPDVAALMTFMFSSWGLALLLLSLLSAVVLLRYRAALPLVILIMTAEQVGRKVLSEMLLPRSAEAGVPASAWINWGLSAALVLSLLLSLLNVRRHT